MQEGDFIKINFTGRIKDGQIFDTTHEDEAREAGIYDEQIGYGPKTVVLGQDSLVEGLDEALLEAEVGESGEVVLDPEGAFGERQDEAIISMKKREYEKQFDQPPRRGAQVEIQGQRGRIISNVGGHVRIDTNHPLAGETVVFDYEVLERIEEPEEKVRAVLETATDFEGDRFEVSMEEEVVTIEPPEGAKMSQAWLFSKPQISERIFSGLEVDEVKFVESFSSPPDEADMDLPEELQPREEDESSEEEEEAAEDQGTAEEEE